MKKFFWLAVSSLCFLSACQDPEVGGKVDYDHEPNAICPGPITVSPQAAQEFNQFAGNPLIMQFYKYYLQQQRDLAAFQQHDPKVEHCPAAFWVQDNVAAEFAKLPEGDPLREFFKAYAAQQRALDAYYKPAQGLQ